MTMEEWSTSKCQRLLRPFKAKISALRRLQVTTTSVVDGISAWQASAKEQRKLNTDIPAKTSIRRKYGARAQREQIGHSSDNLLMVDPLGHIRTSASPALCNAYLGVYHAFKNILARQDTSKLHRSRALTTLASDAIGLCIHLTSSQFTDQPIESDDWFESIMQQYRPDVSIAYAIRLVASAFDALEPLIPAFMHLLHDTIHNETLMQVILQNTIISATNKKCMLQVFELAKHHNLQTILVRHYCDSLDIQDLEAQSLSVILEHRSEEPLSFSLEMLYQRIFRLLRSCRACYSSSCPAHQRLVEQLSSRVFANSDRLLIDLGRATGTVQKSPKLSLAFILASLTFKPDSTEVVKEINTIYDALHTGKPSILHNAMKGCLHMFASQKLVEIVELLVGRCDALALALANLCARHLEGDFFSWADEIEREIMEAKHEGTDKYRFEPLLDSWVARTPGVTKVRKARVLRVEDSDDEDELTLGISASQDTQELVSGIDTPSQHSRIAMSHQSESSVQSARLLKRFRQIIEDRTGQPSPHGVGCQMLADIDTLEEHSPCKGGPSVHVADANRRKAAISPQQALPIRSTASLISLSPSPECSPTSARITRTPLVELKNTSGKRMKPTCQHANKKLRKLFSASPLKLDIELIDIDDDLCML